MSYHVQLAAITPTDIDSYPPWANSTPFVSSIHTLLEHPDRTPGNDYTSYKFLVNLIFMLIAGAIYLDVTFLAVLIVFANPRQLVTTFHGRAEAVQAVMSTRSTRITQLTDPTKLKWVR
jgi:hypothetical protein